MLPPGHLATGYLISQIPNLRHEPLKKKEVGLVMLGSIVFDFDFFLPYLFGYPGGAHHYFPIHTLLGGVLIFTVIYLFARHKVSKTTLILTVISMLSHLMIDDSSHLFYLLGWEKYVGPQIFWLYPFDPRRQIELDKAKVLFLGQGFTNTDVLKTYMYSVPSLFRLEIATVTAALVVFLRKNFNKKSS